MRIHETRKSNTPEKGLSITLDKLLALAKAGAKLIDTSADSCIQETITHVDKQNIINDTKIKTFERHLIFKMPDDMYYSFEHVAKAETPDDIFTQKALWNPLA